MARLAAGPLIMSWGLSLSPRRCQAPRAAPKELVAAGQDINSQGVSVMGTFHFICQQRPVHKKIPTPSICHALSSEMKPQT